MNKTVRQNYSCNRLGETVHLILEYFQLEGSNYKECVGFECDGCKKCGVGIEDRPKETWFFDWSKCEHPNTKR
jgi:hypothetical protein